MNKSERNGLRRWAKGRPHGAVMVASSDLLEMVDTIDRHEAALGLIDVEGSGVSAGCEALAAIARTSLSPPAESEQSP